MTEMWVQVPIPPYGNYEVSSFGRLRRQARVLQPVLDTYGYHTIRLYHEGNGRRFKISRLVCQAFHGPPPSGYVCAHVDGNKTNNHFSNLVWATHAENMSHKIRHGTHHRGERCPTAKLTRADVIEIKTRGASGERPIDIAEDYPVSASHIGNILRGSRNLWQHDSAVSNADAPKGGS